MGYYQTYPGQTYPGQTYPGQTYPGQTYQAMPHQDCCPQCGRPKTPCQVRPTWSLAWGLMWRQFLLSLPFTALYGLVAMLIVLLAE